MALFIVTIDGPAASGKSTVARRLASRIGATFLDTGAMYRAVTFAAMQDGVDLHDEAHLIRAIENHTFEFQPGDDAMRVFVDGQLVTDRIRSPELTANVRCIASSPPMRARLVEMQRQFARRCDRVVTEGRDQGTVVFPDADVKFYLVADARERARRRKVELESQGVEADLDELCRAIQSRDRSDESRAVGPLKPAPDAICVDTTRMSIEEVVECLLRHISERQDANRVLSVSLVPAVPLAEQGPKGPQGPKGRMPRMLRETIKVKWYFVARFLCQMFTLAFFRYRVYGRDHVPERGPFIMAGNHQSFLDPVFMGIGTGRRLLFMARDTLFRSRWFGGLIRSTNAIPLSRDKADIGAIKLVLANLKEGHGVCLYPEGTRTHDGRITAFKPGFGLLCRRSQAPVVPALVDGAFECWPRHRKLFSPGSIVVWFGKPLGPEQIRNMSNEELADWLTQTLRRMQHDCRLKQGKPPYDYTDEPAAPASESR